MNILALKGKISTNKLPLFKLIIEEHFANDSPLIRVKLKSLKV